MKGNDGQCEMESYNLKPSNDSYNCRGNTSIEKVACTGKQMNYQKTSKPDFYPKSVTRNAEGPGTKNTKNLGLQSTRVTVYPQLDITPWDGRRDFSLPKLDVLKVQLDHRWAYEENGCKSSNPSSHLFPGSFWPSKTRSREPSRTRSADSYFHHCGARGSRNQLGNFESRTQMERAFNTCVTSNPRQSASSGRPNTSALACSEKTVSSPQRSVTADRAKSALAWYSASNRQKVVRKSPPWRSLMNRRPQGLRSDKNNLCPYHCRCCFNEVNENEGSSVYKLDLGTL